MPINGAIFVHQISYTNKSTYTNQHMKILKYTLLLTIILGPTTLFAQDWSFEVNDIRDYHRMINHGTKVTDTYTDIEGNPYYFEDFREGSVITKDAKKYNGVFRYDLYSDQIEFKIDEDAYWIANPELVEYLKIDDRVFMFFDKDLVDSKKGYYYEILVMGECKLMKRKGVNLKPAEQAKPYVDAKPATFVDRQPQYFIQIGIAHPQKITNKKSLLELLSDKESEISKFIKKNKISASNENELIDLVNYYNSL